MPQSAVTRRRSGIEWRAESVSARMPELASLGPAYKIGFINGLLGHSPLPAWTTTMLQLAIFIYGIVALFRGVFSVGRGRRVEGTRARILGLICVLTLPAAFVIGLVWGVLAVAGVLPMPGDQPLLILLDVGIVVLTIIIVYVLGNKFYKQQELERQRLEPDPASAGFSGRARSIADPDNPYASPTVEGE